MEPALKPAIERTRTGAVGVMATPATFQGELFNNLVKRYTERLEPQPNGDCRRRRHVRPWASQGPSYYAGGPDVAPGFLAPAATKPKSRSRFPKKSSLYDKKTTISSTENVRLLSQPCPGLVEAVEAGALNCNKTEALLATYLSPMIEADVDQLVLGCTHYPFLRPLIERLMGPGTVVIDPAPSVARQVAHVLTQQETGTPSSIDSKPLGYHAGNHIFYTSSDVAAFTHLIRQLLSPSLVDLPEVRPVAWPADRLEMQPG
jgi:glutamate racemase